MPLLSKHTGERLRQLAARSPGADQGPGASGRTHGRPSIFVRCTSATAAATTGVGAQCYPGVIVDPRSGQTTQPVLGTVWLSVLTNGGAAGKPYAGAVYECLLAGGVEATAGDTRPRAFSAMGAIAAKPSSDCARPLGSLRAGSCFSLSIIEALGDCACIDTTQTAALTWDKTLGALTSATALYGCPPGVFTAVCPAPTGAPKKWSSTFAGFTGDYSRLNGGWTWTWTTGSTWVATKSGITATLVMTSGVGIPGTVSYSVTFSGGTAAVNALQYTFSGGTTCCAAVTLSKV